MAWNRTLAKPRAAAALRARASFTSSISIPVTRAGATKAAISIATLPPPQTQVDRIHAGPQASPAEQGSCLRPPGSRENLEPFVSLLATPYDVALHERDYPCGVGLR